MGLNREKRKLKPSPHDILVTSDIVDEATGKRVVRFAPRKFMRYVREHTKTKSKRKGAAYGTQR